MTGRIWISFGALLAAVAVGMGAFGAHGLEKWLPNHFEDVEKRLANWETATRYMMFHSLGIMVAGILLRGIATKLGNVACLFFGLGILLFCGCLFGWVITDSKPLVMIVPLGGVAFIVGWVCLALTAFKIKQD